MKKLIDGYVKVFFRTKLTGKNVFFRFFRFERVIWEINKIN